MISLTDILKASNGQLFGESVSHLFTDFCFDSREAKESQLFVAMRTDSGDSHQYIQEAIKNGVIGVICTRPPDSNTDKVTVIIVKDPLDVLMKWTQMMLARIDATVIAVAGSSARSTSAEAVQCVLAETHNVYFRDVDVSGRLGIVIGLAGVLPSHNAVVLKFGTTFPGEMAEMIEMAQPDIVVMTHIDCYHTDEFDSCSQLIQEFHILAESLPKSGYLIVNHDDENARTLAPHTQATVVSVGIDSFGTDFMAFNVVIGANGTGFDLRFGGERRVGRWTPLLSKYHLYSIMYALAVGHQMAVDVDTGLDRLKALQPLSGRMKPFTGLNGCLLVDDTYGANSLSMTVAISWLHAIKYRDHRTVLIIGDMDNLGVNNQQGHRRVGQALTHEIDYLITKGSNAALVGRSAIDNGMNPNNVKMTYSVQDVVYELQNLNLTELDVVLVKGGNESDMALVTRTLMQDDSNHQDLVRQTQLAQVVNVLSQSILPSRVEIDTEALANNVRLIKAHVGDEVGLMAVVKANGYGHGAVTVARTALLNGATYLAVANMAEAMDLRDAGITVPILILSYVPVFAVRQAIQQNISVLLFDSELAQQYERIARDVNGKLKIHIKVDSGMGRMGVLSGDAVRLFRHVYTMQNLEIEGIYTHFSVADEDLEYTDEQLQIFKDVVAPLRATGFQFKYIHAANSAGTLGSRDNYFNLVRCGLLLYGLSPSDKLTPLDGLQPVMSWKTVVGQVKKLPPNSAVGYGNTYRTRKHETIAVLPVGYADGLRRSPHTWREVLVHGKRAPVVGRVSMEKTTINVTSVQDVSIGDEVVLLGRQGADEITADEIAHWLGTINYEVVTSILSRISRS
jgi:Alr-MurF fusion protein